MKTYISAACAALVLAVIPACSGGEGGGNSGASKLAQLDPPEARQRLMENGYMIDQNGFREAVDYLDADTAALFIAMGFDTNAMADALSYPVNRMQTYDEAKLRAHLEANLGEPAYRAILATMFENGMPPSETLEAPYTTSLTAEALRLGDEDFIGFLGKHDADWNAKPGCYQHHPRCKNHGTMAGWLFYIPATRSWTLEESLDAYERLQGLTGDEEAGDDTTGETSADPYLMAAIAYHKFLWSADNADVDALWQEVGSPRPIMPYGQTVEEEAQNNTPLKSSGNPDWDKNSKALRGLSNSGKMSSQRRYLNNEVFGCIADNGGDYYACLENPPAED
ncbi:hypothetical protein [Henriciella aquimarina]|uniref:hypothetical protein n=1 Tax=Henriciella aquimarina TaxID=545261 RepID=UPI000A07714A|nr:hypothetical protein [Henriciella aquimarina]